MISLKNVFTFFLTAFQLRMSRDTPNYISILVFTLNLLRAVDGACALVNERTHLAQGSSGAHGLFKHFDSRHG